MNAAFDWAGSILGLGMESKDLTFLQISLRGILVFIVSEHDLLEDLCLNGNAEDLKLVKAAYQERNGQVSVVK